MYYTLEKQMHFSSIASLDFFSLADFFYFFCSLISLTVFQAPRRPLAAFAWV